MGEKRKKPANAQVNSPKPDTERLVYRAMQSLGWLFPTTPEEVAQAEADLAEYAVPLPERLREPGELFEKHFVRREIPALSSEQSAAAQNLACAAREGGVIPADVRAQMTKDRGCAEQEVDDSK